MFFLMISFATLLTIIVYLLTDDLHNKDIKWEVALFIRFSKVIVYENYIYIYIYIYVRSTFGRSLLLSEWGQTQRAQYNKFGREDGLKNWALVRVATTGYDHTKMEWSHTQGMAKVYPQIWSEDWFFFFSVLLCLATEAFWGW